MVCFVVLIDKQPASLAQAKTGLAVCRESGEAGGSPRNQADKPFVKLR